MATLEKKIVYKEATIRLMGWTPERYDKEYDKYRLRVRQFERETNKKDKIHVGASLYYTLKRQKQGKELTPQKQAILNTPAYSQSKKNVAKRARRKKKTLSPEEARARDYLFRRISGLMAYNPKLRAYILNEDIEWSTKKAKIFEYLNKMNATQREKLEAGRKEVEAAEKEGRPADLEKVYKKYGDANNYEADFDFE